MHALMETQSLMSLDSCNPEPLQGRHNTPIFFHCLEEAWGRVDFTE